MLFWRTWLFSPKFSIFDKKSCFAGPFWKRFQKFTYDRDKSRWSRDDLLMIHLSSTFYRVANRPFLESCFRNCNRIVSLDDIIRVCSNLGFSRFENWPRNVELVRVRILKKTGFRFRFRDWLWLVEICWVRYWFTIVHTCP